MGWPSNFLKFYIACLSNSLVSHLNQITVENEVEMRGRDGENNSQNIPSDL